MRKILSIRTTKLNLLFVRIFIFCFCQWWPWIWCRPRLSRSNCWMRGILQEPSLWGQCWRQVLRSLGVLHQEPELSGVAQLPHAASSGQTEDRQAAGGIADSPQLVTAGHAPSGRGPRGEVRGGHQGQWQGGPGPPLWHVQVSLESVTLKKREEGLKCIYFSGETI